MTGEQEAILFGKYIAKRGLIGDYKPAFPETGEELIYGFSEVKIEPDGTAEAVNFRSVEDVYEEFVTQPVVKPLIVE